MAFSAPLLLTRNHDLTPFDSGNPTLNLWLQRHALSNQERRASRTYAVIEASSIVIAYYSLAAGSVTHAETTSKVRRNMPDPIPVALLGRLAVDGRFHSAGLGHGLLKDAVLRVLQAADLLAIRGMLVDAIDEPAKAFYERFGFRPSPVAPMKLMISIEEAEAAIRTER